MSRTVTSAPGKVILSGEYAVLAGAPALSMAVNRRAVTTVDVLPGGGGTGRLQTPGLMEGEWRFAASPAGRPDWIDTPPPRAASVLDAACAVLGEPLPALSVCIDTRAFYDDATGLKLGLGSSAAAMTSVMRALDRLAGHDRPAMPAADLAHRAMQGGGSGIDIATSLHGGLIRYARSGAMQVESCEWPAGLEARILWSGSSSNTGAMIGRLDADSWAAPAARSLIEAAHAAVRSWQQGDGSDILAAFRRYAECLRRFGIDRRLGIFEAGHDALFELARGRDVAYKPSGAGGGDIGVALGLDETALRRFCDEAARHGFRLLDLSLDPVGAADREEEYP